VINIIGILLWQSVEAPQKTAAPGPPHVDKLTAPIRVANSTDLAITGQAKCGSVWREKSMEVRGVDAYPATHHTEPSLRRFTAGDRTASLPRRDQHFAEAMKLLMSVGG
jgi:hypothetical protein